MDAPGNLAVDSPASRAAFAVWITAGIEVILFGACALVMGLAAMTPADQLRQMELPAGVTPEQLRIAMWVVAGMIAGVMWLPGLALLFLGFGVKEGRPGQTLAAGVILVFQAAVLGVFVVLPVISTLLAGGALLGVVVHVAIFGGLLWLVIWAARRVFAARRTAPVAAPTDEPWNSHLGGGW